MFTDIPKEIAQDPWIKIVGMLQQNWAAIIEGDEAVKAVFYDDTRCVFDEISFSSAEHAESALLRNGFTKYRDDPDNIKFIALPKGEFREGTHPNGPIYSSGRFWI